MNVFKWYWSFISNQQEFPSMFSTFTISLYIQKEKLKLIKSIFFRKIHIISNFWTQKRLIMNRAFYCSVHMQDTKFLLKDVTTLLIQGEVQNLPVPSSRIWAFSFNINVPRLMSFVATHPNPLPSIGKTW